MKNLSMLKRLCLVALLAVFGVGLSYAGGGGGTTTYYAKVRASVGTGSGKVYASESTTNNPSYGDGNVVTKDQSNNQNFTFYMYARAENGYEFTGWSTTKNGTELSNSAVSPYSYQINSNASNESSATENQLYAFFRELPTFYFSASAISVPSNAGTASVSPAVTNVYGEHWNSTSATTNAITFTATSGANHVFQGWSRTENGEIESSANPYKPTITSNSTNSGSPSNTTLYARFLPYPTGVTASPASMILGAGDSETINAVVTPSGSYSNIGFESSNTSVATVNANGVVTAVSGGEATITVKAFKSDGVTVIATASVSVSVIEKCATPDITFEPSSDGKTATTTLSTTTENASIHYTIGGGEPSTSSTQYTGPFNVNNGQTVRAITVKPGCKESEVTTSTFVAEKVALPSIDIASNGVSFSCETPGVRYFYTTNGDVPTTALTPWNGTPITGLSEGTTIKVIAAKTGMIPSDIASKIYYPATGVSGSVVTLNDYEDHNWSYYSDAECPIHSWNPADVKITYYGNGTATVAANNDNNPTSFTANATGVKVGIDADASTFVYYKTLERTDGSTAASPNAATGRCAYTTIPNPFSVRPTYGSGDTRWRGFYKWRVKRVSGGTIYSASTGGTTYGQGSTIDAEEEIYFAPSSEYGMEVEFEALWARAYVTTGTSNLSTTTDSYERNFHVVSSSTQASSFAKSYPLTVTSYYPDGTRAGGGVTGAFTAQANTKFENIAISGATNSTWIANGHDLIVGRGCSGTVNYVKGINGDITSPNYTIRLESGTYNYFSALRGYQTTNGSNGTDTGSKIGGVPSVKVIFGCDYDRATNSGITDNLVITNGAFYGYTVSDNNTTYSETAFCAFVKSGKVGKGFTIDNSYEAKANGAFYIGIAGERVPGCRNLLIEGGQIASIAGGIDNSANQNNNSVKIRMKGGHVRGVVYGGGARSAAYGDRSLIFTGGTVTGWIGGGCNGEPMSSGQDEDTYGGITHGASFVYFGGNAICGGEGSDVSINGSTGGIVFGAGKGVEGNTTSGRMANGTTVAIADNCNIQRNVYGGGNYGYAQTSTNLFIGGGVVQGGVFGGSNMNNGPIINILMKDGIVNDGLYGGSNNSGTIENNVTMQIHGGQVGTSSKSANIHGGGYGKDTKVNGDVTLTLGANPTGPGVTVYGDVYGGSALGTVNDAGSDKTSVTLNSGTINGSLYGGGLGDASNAATVNGAVAVTVNGGSVKKTAVEGSGGVYGANNINGAPQRSVTVDIYGTDPAPSAEAYALYAVYGGGNQADYGGKPIVTVKGCDNSIEYVYGGGNAASVQATDVTIWGGNTIGNVFGGGHGYKEQSIGADVTNNVKVDIKGGTINRVFGGSNSMGNIGGTISLNINKDGSCPMNIAEVYGGGNEAAGNAGVITIGCTGGEDEGIGDVYGGANAADINSDITLNITGGNINNVFGGNNTSGNISGKITVNVENTGDCGLNVNNVYGAGNKAAYGSDGDRKGDYPQVNIKSGTVNENVYGGGLGESAIVYGNPQVSMTGAEVGNVFGGGNAAEVKGNTNVNITGGNVRHNVYGGGNQANVTGQTNVVIGQ